MKYDWEEGIEKIFDFEDINNTLDELTDRHRPIDFNPKVIGVIMANTYDAQACLVVNPEFDQKNDQAVADMWLDVSSDVEAQRHKAMGYDH